MRTALAAKFGILGFLFWGTLWFLWEILKDAIFGFINNLLSTSLGVEDLRVEDTYPVLTTYGPPITLALIAGLIVYFVYRLGSRTRTDFVRDEKYPAADLDQWRGTDPLLLWQAGCLWNGIKPRYPVEFENPAYAAFSMLLRGAEHGEFDLIKREPDPYFAYSQVTRHELAKYAVKKNDVPEFLKDIIPSITDEPEYIELHEAATRAYEETEQTTVAHFAEMPLPGGKTAVLSWYAYALIGKGSDTRIYGKRPPSRQRRPIPTDEIPRCRFSDDARSLTRHSEKQPRFVELEIRRSDFERRLEEIKKWNAE